MEEKKEKKEKKKKKKKKGKKKKTNPAMRRRERWRHVKDLGRPVPWTPDLERELRRNVTKVTMVLCKPNFMPEEYKPKDMRRYWVPVSPVSEATDYDEAKHGVVVFISNTPFMGPHPVPSPSNICGIYICSICM